MDRIYPIIAAVLPAMLGLGLIELYVERNVGIDVVVAAMAGLAAVMILIAALSDVADESRRRRARIGD
jgi:hypothetical protein